LAGALTGALAGAAVLVADFGTTFLIDLFNPKCRFKAALF